MEMNDVRSEIGNENRKIWREWVGMMLLGLMAMSAFGQNFRKTIAQPAPAYPEIARHLALTGSVKIHVVIAPDGHIKETKVVGGHPVLVQATLEALEKWKYAPASAETTADLEFNFHP